MPLPSSMPSKRKIVAAAVVLFFARLLYKFSRWVHHVLTSEDRSKQVPHNCIPPADFKHTKTQQETLELVKQLHPELLDLVENGHLIAIQPAKMLAALLAEHSEQTQQQEGQQQEAQPAAAEAAAEDDGLLPGLSQADVSELLASRAMQACLAAPAPELMFVVGTVHVAKQSGEDVKRIMKAICPAVVIMELCQGRLQAMLIDPYANPLTDMEPCPNKLAQQSAVKHRGVGEVVRAALTSRDHNVLTTMMGGLYSQLEDKLEIRAGIEFIAARQALIEQQQEQEQEQQQQQEQGEGEGDAEARSWLSRVVPGDRPVSDTLLGLWGALRPWRRLQFIGDLMWGIMSGIDEETIATLAQEDVVEMMLKEFSQSYPEVMKPLLHDRNWVLATNTWRVAQAAQAPVLAIVGKGHLSGMVYVVQRLVEVMARAGGSPILVQRAEREQQQQEEQQQEEPVDA